MTSLIFRPSCPNHRPQCSRLNQVVLTFTDNVIMNMKSSTRKPILFTMVVLLKVVYCQTTKYSNTGGIVVADSTTDPQEDKTVLAHMVRLYDFILGQPSVEAKIPPVETLESGETAAVRVRAEIGVSLLGVDDARQAITTSFSCIISWEDSSLQWNSSHYGGVGKIELGWGSAWTPLIRVLNGLDPDTDVLRPDLVTVNSNGRVTATALFRPETMCRMNHDKFPYDTQSCPLVIVPMSSFVNLETVFEMHKRDISSDLQKPDWELVKLITTYLGSDPGVDPFPIAQVELRRLTTFYTVCLVIPMVLTSYMNTMVFLVPLQSGEKVSFIVSIFVSTSVFTNFFSTIMPRGLDSVPTTMKLFVGVVLESLVILVATLFVMWQFHSQSDPSVTVSAPSEVPFQSESNDLKEETSKNTKKPQQPNAQPVVTGLCASNSTRPVQVAPLATSHCRQESKSSGATFAARFLKRVLSMPAERMDKIFFALFFVANTVLISLLYSV